MTVQACIQSLPKTVKIGPYDWRVTIEDVDNEGIDLCGQTVFESTQVILWPKNLTSPSHVVGIVFHEFLHVIFDNHGLGQLKRGREEREEQIILGFESGVVSLLRDNPKLMTWMRRWLR